MAICTAILVGCVIIGEAIAGLARAIRELQPLIRSLQPKEAQRERVRDIMPDGTLGPARYRDLTPP